QLWRMSKADGCSPSRRGERPSLRLALWQSAAWCSPAARDCVVYRGWVRHIESDRARVTMVTSYRAVTDDVKKPQGAADQAEGGVGGERAVVSEQPCDGAGGHFGGHPVRGQQQGLELREPPGLLQVVGEMLVEVPVVRTARPAAVTPGGVGGEQ